MFNTHKVIPGMSNFLILQYGIVIYEDVGRYLAILQPKKSMIWTCLSIELSWVSVKIHNAPASAELYSLVLFN